MAHTPNEAKQGQRMTAKAVFREEIYDMRAVPFGFDDITRLAAATAAPLVPLRL